MTLVDIAVATAGAVLVFLAVRDVLLSLAHLDLDGPLGSIVQRLVWRVIRAVASRMPAHRRAFAAAAGPLMLTATVGAWAACYLLGYALLVWPHMQGGFAHLHGQQPDGTFLEALYFSGTAATTLGFGDIVPINGFTRALAISEALLGLAMLTGVVTYLLNAIGAVVDRNHATLTIHEEAGAGEDGVGFVLRVLDQEDEAALVRRLDTIAATLRAFYVRAYHYPIVHLFYRSGDPVFDPEPAFRTALEAAIAAHLVGRRADARGVRGCAGHLGRAMGRLMKLIATDYLPVSVRTGIAHPAPTAADHALVAAIQARVDAELPGAAAQFPGDEAALALACQGRLFLDALDKLTQWRRDHPRAVDLVGLS